MAMTYVIAVLMIITTIIIAVGLKAPVLVFSLLWTTGAIVLGKIILIYWRYFE